MKEALSELWPTFDAFLSAVDLIATIGLFITVIFFVIQQRRANRIERQENYLRIELASNDLFKFEGEHAEQLQPYMSETYTQVDNIKDEGLANSFYFMTLNLFEISIRLRKDGTISEDVFGSWVIWYYDTLTSGFFRKNWPVYRENYTVELRTIFDEPVNNYETGMDDNARKQVFFQHVSEIIGCDIIRKWLPNTENNIIKSVSNNHLDNLVVQWILPEKINSEEISRFMLKNIRTDSRYISHSEYFEGRSNNGSSWSPDLDTIFLKGMNDGFDRDTLLVRKQSGDIVAAALVNWSNNGYENYGVIEDMAVDRDSRRKGIGNLLLKNIEMRATENAVNKLFLESGVHNHSAHSLFKKTGFEVFSKTFCKNIS